MRECKVKPANGKLGVMCVGLGAVTTTTIIGTLMARKGLAKPVGSFACEGIMRVREATSAIRRLRTLYPLPT